MSRSQHRSATSSLAFKGVLVAGGLLIGVGELALGAYLTSGNNGWSTSLLFSVVGLVGAVLAAYSWSSRRSRACMAMAGIAVALCVLGSMGMMLDLSQETSGIVHAWSQVPLAVLGWMCLWLLWLGIALGRLFLFEPPRTRHRLSSRRGDAGS